VNRNDHSVVDENSMESAALDPLHLHETEVGGQRTVHAPVNVGRRLVHHMDGLVQANDKQRPVRTADRDCCLFNCPPVPVLPTFRGRLVKTPRRSVPDVQEYPFADQMSGRKCCASAPPPLHTVCTAV
jgi:hypothetical protein